MQPLDPASTTAVTPWTDRRPAGRRLWSLVKNMVMEVDQPREDITARCVDDLGGLEILPAGIHDSAEFDGDVPISSTFCAGSSTCPF